MIAVFATVLGIASAASAQSFELGDDDEWREVRTAAEGSPEAQLERIRAALADRRWSRAEFLATRWIDTHRDHPSIAEALLARGDALRGRGDSYEALFDYELIARAHPGSEAFVRALEREYEIADEFLSGKRRKIAGLRIVNARDEAEELMIRIQERLPGSRLAERAALRLADHYFAERRMTLAGEMYAIFLQNHPRSKDVEKARKRLIAANLAAFKGPEFDASGLVEARIRIEEAMAEGPTTLAGLDAPALLVRIDESRARKQLTTARWYDRSGDPVSAEHVLRRLVDRFPGTAAAVEGAAFGLELMDRLPTRRQGYADRYRMLAGALASPAANAVEPDTPADMPGETQP